MKKIFFLIVPLIATAAFAQVLTEAEREHVITTAHKNFWGDAVLSNGAYVQPTSEAERNTLPIPKALANSVADAGAISGLGQWCGLEWQSHYLSITKSARKNGMNETQVAFIGFLHGIAQGSASSAMKNTSCDDQIKVNVQKTLDQSKANWMKGT